MFKIPANTIAVSLATVLFSAGIASAAFVDYNLDDTTNPSVRPLGFILDKGINLGNHESIIFERKAGGVGDFVFSSKGDIQLRFGKNGTSTGNTASTFGIFNNSDVNVFSINANGKMTFGKTANNSFFAPIDDGSNGTFLEMGTGMGATGIAYNHGLILRKSVTDSVWGMVGVRNLPSATPATSALSGTGAVYLGYNAGSPAFAGLYIADDRARATGDVWFKNTDTYLNGMSLYVDGGLYLPFGGLKLSNLMLNTDSFGNITMGDVNKKYIIIARNFYVDDIFDGTVPSHNSNNYPATKGWIDTQGFVPANGQPAPHVDWSNILEVVKMDNVTTSNPNYTMTNGTVVALSDLTKKLNEILTITPHAPY